MSDLNSILNSAKEIHKKLFKDQESRKEKEGGESRD